MIVLNKAHITGKEIEYISETLRGQTSGNGPFTKKCHKFFSDRYGFKKSLLTTSCTDAIEMAAILSGVGPGDEVIMPSFTFVSTANPFILRGAKVIFADSQDQHPNLDISRLKNYITPNTKAIVVVHYAGVAIDMDAILKIANENNLLVIEDAAQAIDAFYKGKPLGSLGHFGCFSFHDTKNIVSGEGGLLTVNDSRFIERAEILWEKGTNRSAFIRGEVDKYGWVDVGSSFLPSELTAAFLLAQLENLDEIQAGRMKLWQMYFDAFAPLQAELGIQLPQIPDFAKHNAHIFYLVCDSVEKRNFLIKELKLAGIQAYFHYPPLHLSKYFLQHNKPQSLPNSHRYFDQLIRLPLFYDLTETDQNHVINSVVSLTKKFSEQNAKN